MPTSSETVSLRKVRETTGCYGNYRAQTLDHALRYCLRCGVVKTCVRKTWERRSPHTRRQFERD